MSFPIFKLPKLPPMKYLAAFMALSLVVSAFGQELIELEWIDNQPMSTADVQRAESGEIYLASTIYNNPEDTAAAIAMKFNANLELEWAKQLRTFNDDDFGSVHILSDGNILYGGGLGAFFSPLLGGSLYKVDPDGNVLWSKVYPGSDDDRISEIFELNNGELLLANRRGVSNQPTFFLHTDSQGNILEQFTLTYEDQALKPTSMTFDGTNFYAASRVFNDALEPVLLLMAFNLNEVIWAKTVNPGQEFSSGMIFPKPNGGFSVLGRVVDEESVFNGLDIWLFETDETGNPGWSKHLFRPNNGFTELGSGLVHLDDGFLVSYRFQTEFGLVPVFSRFDDQGNLIWIRESLGSSMSYLTLLDDELALMAGPGSNGGVGLGISSVDGVTACGTVDIEVQVDDLSVTTTDVIVTFDESDIEEDVPEYSVIDLTFEMEELCSATLSLGEVINSDFRIYPNPAAAMCYIDGLNKTSVLDISDISGRVLISQTMSDTNPGVDLKSLSPGIYLISIDGTFAGRILVER